jgi:putative ATP-binding cassette transporter
LPFFRSEARGRALGGLGVLVALLLTVNGMNVVNSYVGRDFMTALAERHTHEFFVFAGLLAFVFAISTVVQVLARYAEQWLGVVWREWLSSRFLDRYLAGRAYLRLADQQDMDNPDERISLDVQNFTTTTLSIVVMLFNGIVTLVAFSWVLWSISFWLFLTAIGYAVLGSVGTILLGRRLIGLNHEQIKREADFRYALGRLREHAAAVAQVAGEEEQKGRLLPRLSRLVDNLKELIRVGRNLGFFIVAIRFMPQIIPVIVVAPLYINGSVEFGAVTQAAMAFAQVQGAFALLETQYQDLTAYAAVVQRLGTLWEATEPVVQRSMPAVPLPRAPLRKTCRQVLLPTVSGATVPLGPVVETSPDARRVVYEHLTLWTAEEQKPLVQDLSAETPEGKRLAITGPKGAGKVLLLATAGLWQEGQGRIRRPGPGEIMFVPRRPYAASGRLREILLSGLGQDISDVQLKAVLDKFGVQECVARAGGLEADQDWAKVLSDGELQALTFARLLLAKPRFAFLDNPTSSIETPLAQRLYQALAHSSITYVSAGCPSDFLAYHDLRLDIHEDGSWQLESAGPEANPPREGAEHSDAAAHPLSS